MRKSAIVRIRKQVDRLSNMISELLEFTRGPQSGADLAPANYGAFVKEIVTELEPDLEAKGVRIVLRNDPPDLKLALNQKRLDHVFSNLIYNAVDAMPRGGTVFLSFEVTASEVITSVEDTGPGIPPEIASRLFEPFTTFGKAKGTGLGLSICKKIVEDHRGWIRANTRTGQGASFSFALPK